MTSGMLPGPRMPAEWEPHEATWLSWPHNPDTWPGKFEPVPAVFAEIVAALHGHEEVRILVGDPALEESARRVLRARGCEGPNVRFFRIPTNDCWARDHGPIFVFAADGRLEITDWTFNSWGAKYGPWELDDVVPTRIGDALGVPVQRIDLVLEGGSIDVNGRGTLLTTESCLLNPNRNAGRSREDLESELRRRLGVRNVLWLGEGIAGDDTDGHVDDLTRFVGPATVVTVVEEDPQDENYAPLRENLRMLAAMKDETGRPLEIVRLPMPKPIHHEGQRLPASYANFYIGNGAVLVPAFGDPNDQVACETLARLFPGRTIAPIPCTDLVWGLGAVHCVTQQQPAPRRPS
ncbi:MAG: agmatine deiminase family protein [Candidatus Binatia bacterium]